jgi:catechol 2,3-dioxygenase-like lactoylglutathione lyase family enzyme
MSIKFRYLSPILWTKNLEQTISIYETILGFKKQSQFPDFASMIKNDVEIMFVLPTEEPKDCKDSENKDVFFL